MPCWRSSGGLRRITSFAEIVASLRATIYLLAGVCVVAINLDRVPDVLGDIVLGAFGRREATGGAARYAVSQAMIQGFRRAHRDQPGRHLATRAQSEPRRQRLLQTTRLRTRTDFRSRAVPRARSRSAGLVEL
ncbi:MAG: sodium:alanine symporter family protein [Ilumatobacteraceae bacterium]|nr:sodium:alanine symporter family protein [Ilumatobacteraceae bacterium]